MTTAKANRLTKLAAIMGLTVTSTVALPSVITHAASKMGMQESNMIELCFTNDELREYLAGICRQVA